MEVFKIVRHGWSHFLLSMPLHGSYHILCCWKKEQGSPGEPSTYRPLRLLDIVSKMIEKRRKLKLQEVIRDADNLQASCQHDTPMIGLVMRLLIQRVGSLLYTGYISVQLRRLVKFV